MNRSWLAWASKFRCLLESGWAFTTSIFMLACVTSLTLRPSILVWKTLESIWAWSKMRGPSYLNVHNYNFLWKTLHLLVLCVHFWRPEDSLWAWFSSPMCGPDTALSGPGWWEVPLLAEPSCSLVYTTECLAWADHALLVEQCNLASVSSIGFLSCFL